MSKQFQFTKHHCFLLEKTSFIKGTNRWSLKSCNLLKSIQKNNRVWSAILNAMLTQDVRFCWLTQSTVEKLVSQDKNYRPNKSCVSGRAFKFANTFEYKKVIKKMVDAGLLIKEKDGNYEERAAAVYSLADHTLIEELGHDKEEYLAQQKYALRDKNRDKFGEGKSLDIQTPIPAVATQEIVSEGTGTKEDDSFLKMAEFAGLYDPNQAPPDHFCND